MLRPTPDASCALLDIPCACAATRRAARALTHLYDSHLRTHGIEATQFALLSAIAEMGPCSQVAIGRALGLDKTTLSRNVRVLAAAGWIEPVTPATRRDAGVEVTAAGRAVLARARPSWQRAQAAMQAAMSATEWRDMHAVLRRVTEAAMQAAAQRHAARG